MAVGGYDVVALSESGFLGVGELLFLALPPGFACGDYFNSIYIKLKHVVVGELHPKVFLQVVGRQFHSAAHIDVFVIACPGVVHVGVFAGSAPCGIFNGPCRVVEIGACPVGAGLPVVVYASGPSGSVDCHRGDR